MFGRTRPPHPYGHINPGAFSDAFRTALDLAARESARLRHEYIGTEHLLLGLLATGTRGPSLLESLGVNTLELKLRIETACKPGTHSGVGAVPYTSRAKKTLELAVAEAARRRAPVVEFDFLLLGIVLEGKGIAAQVLAACGLSADRARSEASFNSSGNPSPALFGPALHEAAQRDSAPGEARAGDTSQRETAQRDSALRDSALREAAQLDSAQGGSAQRDSAPREASESQFTVHLYDNSPLSITEQIITQIAEAIATGKLKAGDRLPTVRQLADKLDIAPGTVARSYGELERRGAVQTDGARGTTVAAKRANESSAVAERVLSLSAMLRPVTVEGFHLGATAAELREALEYALAGVMFNAPRGNTGKSEHQG